MQNFIRKRAGVVITAIATLCTIVGFIGWLVPPIRDFAVSTPLLGWTIALLVIAGSLALVVTNWKELDQAKCEIEDLKEDVQRLSSKLSEQDRVRFLDFADQVDLQKSELKHLLEPLWGPYSLSLSLLNHLVAVMKKWGFAASGFRNSELDEARHDFHIATRSLYDWAGVLVPSTADNGYMELGSKFEKEAGAYGKEMEERRQALINAQQRVERLVTKYGLRAELSKSSKGIPS